MKQTLKNLMFAVAVMVASVLAPIAPQAAFAEDAGTGSSGGTGINVFSSCSTGAGSTASGKQICGASQQNDFNKLMTNIINTILLVLGMIAVIMIVIGGIRYTTSNGDASQVKAAKDTVLYAVVGLVVAILAYAIVNFVLAALEK